MHTIVLASGNPGKRNEIASVLADLDVRVVGLDAFPDLPEPEENAQTFAGNARDKARYYARATAHWCLADDSGLSVDALDGAPGIYSARFAADELPPHADRPAIDAANNDKLLRLLDQTPEEKRTARFICCLALADGTQPDAPVLLEASGTIEGRISRQPRGSNGFGYDPLFELPGRGCTTAELAPEEKNAISHRGKAVRRFAEQLHDLLDCV